MRLPPGGLYVRNSHIKRLDSLILAPRSEEIDFITLHPGSMSTSVPIILERITSAGRAFESNEVGSRENLIDLARDLIASLEIPSEFLQRSFWAEVGRPNPNGRDCANHIEACIICTLQDCR